MMCLPTTQWISHQVPSLKEINKKSVTFEIEFWIISTSWFLELRFLELDNNEHEKHRMLLNPNVAYYQHWGFPRIRTRKGKVVHVTILSFTES